MNAFALYEQKYFQYILFLTKVVWSRTTNTSKGDFTQPFPQYFRQFFTLPSPSSHSNLRELQDLTRTRCDDQQLLATDFLPPSSLTEKLMGLRRHFGRGGELHSDFQKRTQREGTTEGENWNKIRPERVRERGRSVGHLVICPHPVNSLDRRS